MDTAFKALSDPTRRKILELLKETDLKVGDIGSHFDITGASLSHHLQILSNAGLVSKRRDGQNIIYSLNSTIFQQIIGWIYSIKEKDHENI